MCAFPREQGVCALHAKVRGRAAVTELHIPVAKGGTVPPYWRGGSTSYQAAGLTPLLPISISITVLTRGVMTNVNHDPTQGACCGAEIKMALGAGQGM